MLKIWNVCFVNVEILNIKNFNFKNVGNYQDLNSVLEASKGDKTTQVSNMFEGVNNNCKIIWGE